MQWNWLRTVAVLALGGVVAVAPATDPVSAVVIVKQGDALGGSTVSTVNAPFTDGLGNVGFVGSLADSQRFIWWKSGPAFFSNQALPDVLTGGESTMGVSNTGGFIYSPSVNGNDAVYTHAGTLLKKGDPIPPLPGLYSTFNSRPTMLPDGTAYWVGGSSPTQGSSSSTNRHLFRATDVSNPASIERVLGGGDVIEGKTIATTASNFDYWISNNGAHHAHVLDMNTGSSNNNMHVYVDGHFLIQESLPTGQGDNWQNFDAVAINDSGNWLLTGDTNAASNDAFVAYNGLISVREGDTLDGVTLAAGAATRAASINNLNQVVQIWGWGSGTTLSEHLFFGDAANLAASIRLLSLGDDIDVDGDHVADYFITDFNASGVIGPGLDLAEDGYVFVDVDMQPMGGGADIQTILRVAVPEPSALLLLVLPALCLRRR